MNGPFVVAQASTNSGKPVQIIKIVKPPAGQTEIFHASFTGTVKIDFTGIADQKITLYHDNSNQTLHVIFADGSQAIIEPFFDSTGSILANLIIEVGANQDLDGAQFAAQFPITEDQSVLPAAGGTNNASGADFHNPSVDPLLTPNPLPLLPPEELPPVNFLHNAVLGAEPVDLIPVVSGTLVGIVEEEALNPQTIVQPTEAGIGNEDTHDASGNDHDTADSGPGSQITTNTFSGTLAPLVTNFDPPMTFLTSAAADGHNVKDAAGNDVTSISDQVFYRYISDNEIDGVTNGEDGGRLIFRLLLNSDGTFTFILNDQIDHPVHSVDNSTTNPSHTPGIFEETLNLDLSSAISAHDATPSPVTFPTGTFEIGVIDDTPVAFQCGSGEEQSSATVVYEDHFDSLGSWDVVGFATTTGDVGTTDPQPDPSSQAILIPQAGEGEGDGVNEFDLESFFNLPFGSIATIANDGDPSNGVEVPTDGSAIRQFFNVQAGDVLTIKFNFLENESDGGSDGEGSATLINSLTQGPAYQDFAFVVVGDQVFRLSDVSDANIPSSAGDGYGTWSEESGYLTFTFTFTQEGNFQVGLGVMNEDDTQVNPALLVDELTITRGTCDVGTLDDESLHNPASPGIEGGPGDDGSGVSLVGVLPISYGADGPSHFDPENPEAHPNPLVFDPSRIVVTNEVGDQVPLENFNAIYVDSNGIGTQHHIDIAWADNAAGGGTLTGTMDLGEGGTAPVFTLTVHTDGTYTFTLEAPLADPFNAPGGENAPGSAWEDNLHIQFGYTATDYDGDSVDGHIVINVDDDVPTASDTVPGSYDGQEFFAAPPVDDEGATVHTGFTGNEGGNGDVPGTNNTTYGYLNFAAGADGLSDLTFAGLDNTAAPFKAIYTVDDNGVGLQETVTYHWDESTHTLTATGDTSDNTVFTLTIDDLSTGHFIFELDSALVHSDTDETGDVSVVLPFTVTDGDGDQATANLTIQVNDDTPTLCLETNSSTYVAHDETPGVDSANGATDVDGSQGITFNGNPTTVAALFSGVVNPGDDPDVSGHGAIGYAQGLDGLVNANVSFGADGAAASNAEVFSLVLSANGLDSGLMTTEGQKIYLYNENGIIVGRIDTDNDLSEDSQPNHFANHDQNDPHDAAAFAITIDPVTGKVYVAQYLSLEHFSSPDASGDISEADTLGGIVSGSLSVSVTVTDGDGDSVTKMADVGSEIQFLDDGPTVSATLDSHFSVVLDETPGLQSFPFGDDNDNLFDGIFGFFALPSEVQTAFNGVANKGNDPDVSSGDKDHGALGFAIDWFHPALDISTAFGADGPKLDSHGHPDGIAYSLTLSSEGIDSGLQTTDGTHIYLYTEGNVIVGRVGGSEGDAAIAITIDDNGHVATAEWLSLQHDDPNADDETAWLASGTVSATVTVTDGDGDTASASADISGQIGFEDDVPHAYSVAPRQVLDDEAQSLFLPVNNGGSGDVSPNLHTLSAGAGTLFSTGADGFGSLTFTPPSGLKAIYDNGGLAAQETISYTTDTHATDSSIPVGHTVLTATGDTSSNTIFTLDVGPDGSYTFTVDEPLVHPLHQTTEENLSINVGFTVTDGDGDNSTGSLTVKVNDDTPTVDVSQAQNEDHHNVTLSQLTLDESIGTDGSDPNAATDDNGSVTAPSFILAPDSNKAIGILSTPTSEDGTSIADLFNVNVSFGADGPQSAAVYDYSLVLKDDHGNPVLAGSSTGVETNLVVTNLDGAPYEGTTDAQRTIYLFHDADGSIVGKIGIGGGGTVADDIALRILITGSASDPQITVEQYLPIEHGNTSSNDESAFLTLPGQGSHHDASLGINLTVTATDGDSDTASDSKTIKLADDNSSHSFLQIQDDGPSITSAYSSGTVIQDETPGVQTSADPNPANDVAGSGLPTGVLTLFNDIVNPGTDPDVSSGQLDNGALGFATSSSPLVHVTADFGTDGPALSNAQMLSLAINGGNDADSGLQTTDGHHILLRLESYGGENLIVGRVDGDGNGHVSTSDSAAFAIELGQDGNISVAQYLSLKNPAPGSDPASLDEAATGLQNIQATVTLTDGDGDHTSQTFDVSSNIVFQDDGPSVSVSVPDSVGNSFFFDGFTLNGNAWGNGSGIDSGTMSGPWTISDANDGHSGADLIPNTGTGTIQLERVGDGYDGGTGTPMHTSTNGFMVDLDASPHDVQLSQVIGGLTNGESYLLTFEAGASVPADAHLEVWFGGQKVFDLDPTNSMQTYSLELFGGQGDGTNLLEFRETGAPDNHGTYLANVTMGDVIVVDETPGIQTDSNETTDAGVIGLFAGVANAGVDPDMPVQYATGSGAAIIPTINFGADGPLNGNPVTATVYSLNVVNGTNSGLATTAGKEIFLFKEGDLIVGRYDSNGDTHVDGTDNAAFAIAMDASGKVSVALYESLQHPDQATFGNGFNSYDEGIYLNSGTLSATVTVTDGDGDTASQSADISRAIRFEDDGPTVSGVDNGAGPNLIANGSFEDHPTLGASDWGIYSGITGWTDGADGTPFEVQTGGAGGINPQDGSALIELDGDFQGNGHANEAAPNGHTDATIQQTVTTVAGQDYELTFYYSPRPGHSGGADGAPADDSGLNVLWNGTIVDSIDSTNLPSGWQLITLHVVGTGSDVLGFQGTGPEDEFGALIDNVSLNAITILDDEDTALNGHGVQGGPGDDGHGVVATGTIHFDAGADGLKQIEVSGVTGLKAIYVDGNGVGHPEDVSTHWVADGSGGGTLTGYTADLPTVFTLTVDNTGHYTFTLVAPLDHPGHDDPTTTAVETSFEDNRNLGFGFTVTDGDGDQATGTISINVDDDTPVANNDIVSGTVSGTVVIDVLANDHPGADGLNADNAVALVTSATHGTVTLNEDHTFSYTPDSGYSGTDSFVYSLTDGDGDTTTATVTLNDGTSPSLAAGDGFSGTVEEEELPNHDGGYSSTYPGNEDTTSNDGNDLDTGTPGTPGFVDNTTNIVSGTLTATGGVGAHTFSFNGGVIGMPVTFGGLPATSGGQSLVYVTDGGGTLYGVIPDPGRNGDFNGFSSGDHVIFAITLSSNGDYTFTLYDHLDHTPEVNNGENTLALDLDGVVNVTDSMSHTVAITGSIDVIDDTPIASSATAPQTLNDEAQTLFPANAGGTGDAVPSVSMVSGSAGSLFSAGADGLKSIAFTDPGSLMAIYILANGLASQETLTFHTETHATDVGVAPGDTLYYASGNVSGNTAFTLLVHPDGSYTFTQDAPLVSGTPTSVTSSLGTQPATEENLAVTIGFTVTDGDNDQATGSLTVNVNDDQPTISAIQDAVMRYVDDTEITGIWKPQFGADGPNSTSAIGVSMFSGTASGSAGSLTYVVTDTHTTVSGNELYQVDVKNGSSLLYTFYEYSDFNASTQSGDMFAFTDAGHTTAFFELDVNANGTYNFHVDTNQLSSTSETSFDSTNHTNSGNDDYITVNTSGVATFGTDPVIAPSNSFPLIIDGFTAADTNPAHHTVNTSTPGMGVDSNNFNTGDTLTFTFFSQQTEVDIGVGKSNNATNEHFTVQLYDQSHNLLAAEDISLPDGQLLKIDAADWTGTGANAFQNFYEAHVTNAASVTGDDTNLTLTTVQYNATTTTTVDSTTLNFALTTTDGDGDSFTSNDLLTVNLLGTGSNLTGLNGNPEVIAASSANDTITGGTGLGDTVDYSNTTGGVGVTVNLAGETDATAAVVAGAATGDTIKGIENIFGSDYSDTLTAIPGGSILYGGGGVDTLNGGNGDDTLIGGFGDGAVDTLTGNGGNDKFVLDGHSSALHVPAGGTDIISDFDLSGTDSLFVDVADKALTIGKAQTISNGQFTWSGATGGTENDASAWSESGSADKFFYNSGTHELWYSANGTGSDKIDLAHMATGVPVAADVHTF